MSTKWGRLAVLVVVFVGSAGHAGGPETTRRGAMGIGSALLGRFFPAASPPSAVVPAPPPVPVDVAAEVRSALTQQMESLVPIRAREFTQSFEKTLVTWGVANPSDRITSHSWGLGSSGKATLYDWVELLVESATGEDPPDGIKRWTKFPQHRTPEALDILRSWAQSLDDLERTNTLEVVADLVRIYWELKSEGFTHGTRQRETGLMLRLGRLMAQVKSEPWSTWSWGEVFGEDMTRIPGTLSLLFQDLSLGEAIRTFEMILARDKGDFEFLQLIPATNAQWRRTTPSGYSREIIEKALSLLGEKSPNFARHFIYGNSVEGIRNQIVARNSRVHRQLEKLKNVYLPEAEVARRDQLIAHWSLRQIVASDVGIYMNLHIIPELRELGLNAIGTPNPPFVLFDDIQDKNRRYRRDEEAYWSDDRAILETYRKMQNQIETGLQTLKTLPDSDLREVYLEILSEIKTDFEFELATLPRRIAAVRKYRREVEIFQTEVRRQEGLEKSQRMPINQIPSGPQRLRESLPAWSSPAWLQIGSETVEGAEVSLNAWLTQLRTAGIALSVADDTLQSILQEPRVELDPELVETLSSCELAMIEKPQDVHEESP